MVMVAKMFREMELSREEFVCLRAITLLNAGKQISMHINTDQPKENVLYLLRSRESLTRHSHIFNTISIISVTNALYICINNNIYNNNIIYII